MIPGDTVGLMTAAPATRQASSHHLTDTQIAEFDRDGYLVLKHLIPQELLGRLQVAAQDWIEQGERSTDDGEGDFVFADGDDGRRLFRVNYVHALGQPASLELLGCPEILAVAESLTGPNFVPTYESLVFKGEGDGAPIRWHQDAVHPRNHRIVNVDVYLDDSLPAEGSLRVVPGSQHEVADTCELEAAYGWDLPGMIKTDLRAGDVLLHDTMLVHGSEAVRGNRLRRTLYYEFRPAEQIITEGPWDREWIGQRLRLIPLGLRAHRRRFPAHAQFDWRVDDGLRPDVGADEHEELRVVHAVHSPGSHCSAGSVALN